MSVDIWLHIFKSNMEIHLPYGFVFNENVLQEVVSKDPILKIVVDLNINDVGIYQHY